MHPSITGVAEDSYPTLEDISNYIYKHANRYDNKGEVDHLNESIRGRDHEMEKQLEKLMEELEEDSDDDDTTTDLLKDPSGKKAATVVASKGKKMKKKKTTKKKKRTCQGKRTMYQRGLGLFIRIEISKDRISCNDENFMRWGECFFTRFFKFLCFGERGWPENKLEMNFDSTNVGFEAMQTNLKNVMTCFFKNRPSLDKNWCEPPAQDPKIVLPQNENTQQPYSIITQMSQAE